MPSPKIQILRAQDLGFCFGVQRAYNLACQNPQAQILGELVHNQAVLAELKKRGLQKTNLQTAENGSVLIRAHGLAQKKIQLLAKKGLQIIDATCPFVHKIRQAVQKLQTENYTVILLGQKNHPEVQALVTDFPTIIVVKNSTDPELRKLPPAKIGLVAQTTETLTNFTQTAQALQKFHSQVQILNTICLATQARQLATRRLAEQVDLVLVIGDAKSNNTRKLLALVHPWKPAKLVESASALQKSWLQGIQKIGLTAGTSTPETLITAVEKALQQLIARN